MGLKPPDSFQGLAPKVWRKVILLSNELLKQFALSSHAGFFGRRRDTGIGWIGNAGLLASIGPKVIGYDTDGDGNLRIVLPGSLECWHDLLNHCMQLSCEFFFPEAFNKASRSSSTVATRVVDHLLQTAKP